MGNTKRSDPKAMNFESVGHADVPQGRIGKHHDIVLKIFSDLEQLEPGRALKIPLAKLTDSKENVRSALNRATRARRVHVETASDSDFLYVWKASGTGNGNAQK
jgi:hypothetical protein